jgi:hypothetical protein
MFKDSNVLEFLWKLFPTVEKYSSHVYFVGRKCFNYNQNEFCVVSMVKCCVNNVLLVTVFINANVFSGVPVSCSAGLVESRLLRIEEVTQPSSCECKNEL